MASFTPATSFVFKGPDTTSVAQKFQRKITCIHTHMQLQSEERTGCPILDFKAPLSSIHDIDFYILFINKKGEFSLVI